MPILTNPKHERFAQELAKGKTADEAYVLAGYTANRGNASRMNANESILRRVEEIVSEGAKQAGATVERVAAELVKIGFSDIRRAVKWGDTVMVPCAPEVADHFIRADGEGIEEDFEAEVEEELEPQARGSSLKRRRVAADGKIAVRAHTPMALIPSDEIDDATAAAISEVKQTKDGLAFKMHSKLDALGKLGQMLGMFKEKVEVTGKNGAPLETRSDVDIAKALAAFVARTKAA